MEELESPGESRFILEEREDPKRAGSWLDPCEEKMLIQKSVGKVFQGSAAPAKAL